MKQRSLFEACSPGNANLLFGVRLSHRRASFSWHSLQAVRRDCFDKRIAVEFVNRATARFIVRSRGAGSKDSGRLPFRRTQLKLSLNSLVILLLNL
jgi:hypothetical protein